MRIAATAAFTVCFLTAAARAPAEDPAPAAEGATGAEPSPEVMERGTPKIFGCTVRWSGPIPKWSSLNRCIQDKSEAAVRSAKNAAKQSYDSMQSQLNAQVKAAQSQANAAKSQLQSVQGQLASAKKQLSAAQGQVSSLQSQARSLQSQLDRAKSQAASELERAQSSASKLQADLRRQTQDAARQLDQTRRQAEQQVEQARSAGERKLAQAQAEAKRHLDDANARLAQAQAEAKRHLDDANARLAQAQTEASRRLAQAQAEAQRQLDDLNRQLGEAQAEATRLAGEVVDDAFVAKLEAEKQVLLAARQLPLNDLFQCLGTPGPGQTDVADLARQLTSDPARFVVRLQETVWDRAGADIGRLLADGFRNDRLAAEPTRWVSDATAALGRQVPGGQCLADATRPQIEQAGRLAAEIRNGLERRANAAFEEHLLPLVYQGLASGLETAYANALSPPAASPVATRDGEEASQPLLDMDELKRIATGVFAKSMIRKMDSGAEKIDAYACFVDGDDAHAKLADLRGVLDAGAPWPEELYVEFGMEILKAVGHRYIDSDLPGGGSDMAGRAVHVLGLLKDTIGGVVCAAAGLVPEAGAAICEGVYEFIHVAWDGAVAPGIMNVTNPAMHVAHEQFMNVAKGALIEGEAVSRARAALGPLAPLADAFPARQLVIRLADGQLREIQESFDGYNRSVVKLADAFFDDQCIQSAQVTN